MSDEMNGAPDPAAILNQFKDQLFVALLKRCAHDGFVRISGTELDAAQQYNIEMMLRHGSFTFRVERKS